MNKILSFLVVALFSGFTLSAQTQKGSHLLGGSFSVNHSTVETHAGPDSPTSSDNNKSNSFSVGPSYSYFVADNLGLGVDVGYSHSHNDSHNSIRSGETNYNGYSGSISLKKYFLFEKKIGVRTGPFASYDNAKAKSTNTDEFYRGDQLSKIFIAGVALDFVYFPVKKIGLVASLGSLSYLKSKVQDRYYSSKQSNIGLSVLNSPSFSVYYAFGK
jgi:hypothetical protein